MDPMIDPTLRARIDDAARHLARLIASVEATPHEIETVPARGTPEAILFNLEHNQGANITLALRHLEDAVSRVNMALDY